MNVFQNFHLHKKFQAPEIFLGGAPIEYGMYSFSVFTKTFYIYHLYSVYM